LSIPYEKTVLPNGIRVVTGPMTGVKSASLIFYYGVGSRYEPAPIAGVAHFLEHMLFKGTEKRPDPMMISQEIEGVGGVLNAATGREGTSYWCKVPSTEFALAYDVMADILRNSVVDAAELDKERSVIVEEIRSTQDSPEELVHEAIDEVVWGDQPVGRPIAGSEETVGAVDREAMVASGSATTARSGWSSPLAAMSATRRSSPSRSGALATWHGRTEPTSGRRRPTARTRHGCA
jgi:predicted Zn-dependent peptidase